MGGDVGLAGVETDRDVHQRSANDLRLIGFAHPNGDIRLTHRQIEHAVIQDHIEIEMRRGL